MVPKKQLDLGASIICAKTTRGLHRHVSAETSEGNASSDVTTSFSDFDSDDSVGDPNYHEQAEEEENIEDEDRPKEKSRKRKSIPKMWKKNKNKRKRHL